MSHIHWVVWQNKLETPKEKDKGNKREVELKITKAVRFFCGRRQWFFFWVGGIGNGKRRCNGPWSSNYVSMYVVSSNSQNLCIYVLYYVLYYIISLCSGGFTDSTTGMCWFGVCWGNDPDVTRTGCARVGSVTRRVSSYTLLVGGGLRLSGPSSGSNGSVRVYRSVMWTLCS